MSAKEAEPNQRSKMAHGSRSQQVKKVCQKVDGIQKG